MRAILDKKLFWNTQSLWRKWRRCGREREERRMDKREREKERLRIRVSHCENLKDPWPPVAARFNYVCHFIARCLIIKKVRDITQHTRCEPRWPLSGNGTNQPNQTTSSNQPASQPADRPESWALFYLTYSPPRASLRIAALDLRIRANTILAVPYTPDIRSFPIRICAYGSREKLAAFFPRECVKRRERREGRGWWKGRKRERAVCGREERRKGRN